jgi:hypothetical protein
MASPSRSPPVGIVGFGRCEHNAKGVNMKRAVRRIAWIGQAWLTAAMTLVAAVPHFDCRCPDGHFKPFCLSIASDASGCCCGGTCCSPTKEGTCCRGHHPQGSSGQTPLTSCCNPRDSKTSSSPDHVVSHNCCTKNLAPSQIVTVSIGKTAQEATFLASVSPQPTPILSLPRMAVGRPGWEGHLLPPPTDLPTLLHRLII